MSNSLSKGLSPLTPLEKPCAFARILCGTPEIHIDAIHIRLQVVCRLGESIALHSGRYLAGDIVMIPLLFFQQ